MSSQISPKIIFVHRGFKEPTKEAKALGDALEKQGIRVLRELNDGFKHIDLALPEAKLNIEIDGIQHLTDPYQIVADINRGYYSHKSGFATMHIPNEMIRSHLEQIAKGLGEAVMLKKHKIKVHLSA